jgi:hypothetical protein
MDLARSNQFVYRAILVGPKSIGQDGSAFIRGRHFSVLCFVALLVAGGCASVPAPPPSEEMRASLGRIGIRAGAATPSGEWAMPAKGGAAGAGRGAYLGAVSGARNAGILAPFTAVAGAILGATAGAATAEPAAVVEGAEATVQTAFADLRIPDALRDRVVQVAHAETRHTLVPHDDVARVGASGESPERAAGAVDTVLQINIRGYGTKAAWSPNPPVFLFLDAQVGVLRAADGTVLHRRTVTWMSAGRRLMEWSATNGEPVRQELERGIQYLSERIVDVVFLLRSVP